MNLHDLLSFNGKEILFTIEDGIYYIGLKSVLDALGIEASSPMKKTKRDRFLGSRTDTMSIQIDKNGTMQRRKVICLPEKYIYGWLGFLQTDDNRLDSYKEEMYELLYDHFRGTIINRKAILNDIKSDSERIHQLELELKQNNIQKEVDELKFKIKKLNRSLKQMDKDLVTQPELFNNDDMQPGEN